MQCERNILDCEDAERYGARTYRRVNLLEDYKSYAHYSSASVTSRGFILSISSALRASAALMATVVCLDVLVLDPKKTMPPITSAIEAIIATASNLIAPSVMANSHMPPAAIAIFEIRITFRHLSTISARCSISASSCDI